MQDIRNALEVDDSHENTDAYAAGHLMKAQTVCIDFSDLHVADWGVVC